MVSLFLCSVQDDVSLFSSRRRSSVKFKTTFLRSAHDDVPLFSSRRRSSVPFKTTFLCYVQNDVLAAGKALACITSVSLLSCTRFPCLVYRVVLRLGAWRAGRGPLPLCRPAIDAGLALARPRRLRGDSPHLETPGPGFSSHLQFRAAISQRNL